MTMLFCCRFADLPALYLERELRRSRTILQQRLQQPLDRPRNADYNRSSGHLSETHPCMILRSCRISELPLSFRLSDWSALFAWSIHTVRQHVGNGKQMI